MQNILVCTALKGFELFESDELIYLGDWCFDNLSDLNKFKIVNYHWNDRKKLFNDYQYLDNIYEIFLEELSKSLNIYHSTDYPKKHWRILIGPWLQSFIHTIFDRWAMLNKAISENHINSILGFEKKNYGCFIPYSFVDYNSKIDTHYWNQFIYCFIGEFLNLNQLNVFKTIQNKPNVKNNYIKNKLIKFINKTSNLLNNKKEIFLYSTRLDLKSYSLTQLYLRQLPTKYLRVDPPKINPSLDKRDLFFKLKIETEDLFINLLIKLLPLQIPSIYLEGYLDLNNYSYKYLPSRSKLVIDSVAWNSDDVFKNWIAKQIIHNKTKFLISQHGGNYGLSLFNSTEEHQIKISDTFLSWGWKNKNSKIYPLGTYIYQNLNLYKYMKIKEIKVLLIQGLSPKYSSFIFALPISAIQWKFYLKDQIKFIYKLNNIIRSNLTIKFYKNNFEYNEKNLFFKHFPKIKVYDGKSSILEIIDSYSLIVTTYNATTFLETLMLNYPTIIFWDPKFSELRDDAKLVFHELKKVNIFHDSADSAANFVNLIYKDVYKWWYSNDVQSSRKNFVDLYAKNISLKEFVNFLKCKIKN